MGDVVDAIMQDHREFERMFEELKNNKAKRPLLLPTLTTLLTAHSRAEESEVYPVAADEADAGDDVEHSQKEHLVADQLLKKLSETDPEGPDFDSALKEVVDAITHHVKEEESKVLPQMRERLSEERRAQLGDAFAKVRKEHIGEQPADITKAEMEQQAANADIQGASGMSKDQLAKKLAANAEE